jgi:basic amino acid/polyamine antiporter, APA family
VITTIGALLLAAAMGGLARRHPQADGPVGSIALTFGPMAGALVGWASWVSYWAASATVAIAAVSYLSIFAPPIAEPGTAAMAACALIALLTALNLFGARAAGGFQLITTVLKALPLIVVALVLIGRGSQGELPIAPLPAAGFDFSAITTAATLTLWALVGFEAAGLVSGKVRNPSVNVPRATMGGTVLTGLLYIIVCSGIVLTLPAATLAASDAPFALFVETYMSRGAALTIAAFAAISAIGALNGFILVTGELPLAMAGRQLLPGWFGKTNAAGTPVRMIIVSSLLSIILVAANASQSTATLFTSMALLSTSATLWLYLAIAITALRLGILIAAAAPAALYAIWTLWGAGVETSGLSLILMLSVIPIVLIGRNRLSGNQIPVSKTL